MATTPLRFEFEGVVRVTTLGASFLVFTIVVGFAAINTGNNALYIALAFMLGALLLSGVASKGGLKHLAAQFDSLEEAWAGRPSGGQLRLVNRSPIWNVRDVIVTSPELAAPILISQVGRRSETSLAATFLFQRRGLVRLKRLDLYTRFPFGFFLKKQRVRIDGEVIVFPRLVDEDAARERFRFVDGEHQSWNRPGAGTDVYSFRDYVSGDSLRHVYWKKSASLGRWIIKQSEMEAAAVVHVAVDPYKPRGVSDEAFEQMISEAATFLHGAIVRRMDVTLSLPRVSLTVRGGESAIPIYRALALLEAAHEPVAQTVERNAVVFAVGRADERASA